MATSHQFGKEAEEHAANFYRYRKAEVDLIARKDDLLVVLEVKARSSLYFGSPESFVSKKKINLLSWRLMPIFNSATLPLKFALILLVVHETRANGNLTIYPILFILFK